jgi:hypothetical protein
VLLSIGCGVPLDRSHAVDYFQLSADGGNRIGQLNIGIALAVGDYIREDQRRAEYYFDLAPDFDEAKTRQDRPRVRCVQKASDGFEYFVRAVNNSCCLLDVKDPISSIPETVNGGLFRVEAISWKVLSYCQSQSINLPDHVRELKISLSGLGADSIDIPASIEIVREFSVNRFGQVRFPADGCLRWIDGWCGIMDLPRFECPKSVEMLSGFGRCSSLSELIFPADGHLRKLLDFDWCTSLTEIENPPSVEIIHGFRACTKLQRIRFAVDGKLKNLYGFERCHSLVQIEIPRSVEAIVGFMACSSLRTVVFAMDGRLRSLKGFVGGTSLWRIEIPPSVEVISGFSERKALREVIFAKNGRLRELKGISKCSGLRRIEIPASVEIIEAFDDCPNLREIRFAADGRLRKVDGFHRRSIPGFSPHFCHYGDGEPPKVMRRRVHLGLQH